MDTITPHGFPTTGATASGILNPVDNSKILGSASPFVATPKPDYSSFPVYYQGPVLPCCGADAGTGLSNLLNTREGCPRFLWANMRRIDNLAPTDGSAITTIGLALTNEGIADLTLLADDTTLSPAQYADPSFLTAALELNAITAGVDKLTVVSGPFTMIQLALLIQQHKALIALVKCGDGWWTKNGSTDWSPDLFPIQLGNYTDGHYVVLTWSDGIHCYFRNSWSKQWGLQGDGYFDASYLLNVLEVGIGSLKTLPTSVSVPQGLVIH